MELNEFENHILENLVKCGWNQKSHLGVAVSGGADSVCLLLCLKKICDEKNVSLFALTVDHKIRSEAESSGDANFVRELCEKLKVDFTLFEAAPNEINKINEKRKGGIEDAARFLRYQFFEEFFCEKKLAFLCMGHNQDDNLETILMRFLQGSFSLSGIRMVRSFFARPLLDVSRLEIENYLAIQGQPFRTDKTNFDEKYFRNKIRNSLVPLLSEKFPDWQKNILSLREKFSADEEFFECEVAKIPEKVCDLEQVVFEKSVLCQYAESLIVRKLFESISHLRKNKENLRFPYRSVLDFVKALKNNEEKCSVQNGNIRLFFDNQNVYVKFIQNIATESYFFAIIEKEGVYDFPFGKINVSALKTNAKIDFENGVSLKCDFPFCVRSKQSSDKIKTADKKFKSVGDVLSDFKVGVEYKNKIPVIQELKSKNQEIIAIVASVFGFDDWIVRV